ncbi:MAG: homocysteine S-methyltransferase family protein, partial [Mycobacteriaceae bacterium]
MTTLSLPKYGDQPFLTDGGLETDLIHRRGLELEHFAAFPLLDTQHGRALLRSYYDDYVAIARANAAPLLLESPTWRANPDWATLLGYPPTELSRVNTAAIALMREIQAQHPDVHTVVSGSIGPRYDGYSADARLDPDEAADYHSAQLHSFAAAGADLATAYTITHVAEAIGIVRAARGAGLPIAISFTVET